MANEASHNGKNEKRQDQEQTLALPLWFLLK